MIPPPTELQGFSVLTRWLSQHLSTPLPDVDEVTLERSAPGFILALLGSFLFSKKEGYACPPLFPPLTTRFEVNLYLQLG